ncbi:MAG: hypothetical protein NTV32_03345 [Gammaproteobacteria bacterium]|jgi:hypothetical protein|nr:hypothetical protein [Gammaproteobacteria bacterium]
MPMLTFSSHSARSYARCALVFAGATTALALNTEWALPDPDVRRTVATLMLSATAALTIVAWAIEKQMRDDLLMADFAARHPELPGIIAPPPAVNQAPAAHDLTATPQP